MSETDECQLSGEHPVLTEDDKLEVDTFKENVKLKKRVEKLDAEKRELEKKIASLEIELARVRIHRDSNFDKNEKIKKFIEKDGVIYFSVTSDGTIGENWIKHLEGNDFRVGDYAKQMLR
jgi:restriction endonuclease S subunit